MVCFIIQQILVQYFWTFFQTTALVFLLSNTAVLQAIIFKELYDIWNIFIKLFEDFTFNKHHRQEIR